MAPLADAAAVLTHEVHEKRSITAPGWVRGGRLHPRTVLPVQFALKQGNMDKLHDHLMSVSHPDSPSYGQHWSADEVKKTFAPSQETQDTVSAWLVASGISFNRLQRKKIGWISFDASVAEIESLLQTEFHEWKHPLDTSALPYPAVAESYSLPAHIRPHVDFVTPTLHFDRKLNLRSPGDDGISKKREESTPSKRQQGATKIKLGSPNSGSLPKVQPLTNGNQIFTQLEECNKYITLICLRALYGIPILPSFTPTNPANSLGVVEYTPQAFVPEDLIRFFANYSQFQVQKAPTLVSIDGGVINNSVTGFPLNGESNLDLEYAMGLVNPIKVTLYQTGDPIESASFNDFLDALDGSYCAGDDSTQDSPYPDPNPGGYKGPKQCGGIAAPKVVSTSYGYNEHDLTPAYSIRQCNEYAKFGLMGTTWTFSSGDYGTSGNLGQCIDAKTGNYINQTEGGVFNPSFPSTCPYILSVGATQVDPGASVFAPESACQQVIYSGGGFSNYFSLPDYQKSAVKSYFQDHNPPYGADRYNNSQNTRGFPDISANGANYVVALDGGYSRIFGTSASAPTTASILTLINEARLDIGKGPIGFVNPVLYANPWMLNDITNGTNQGCSTKGFSAVPGWDPVTGLGTPNYPRMLAYFLSH